MSRACRILDEMGVYRWTRNLAQVWLDKLNPMAEAAGFEISLVGSVATRGYSDKDVDFLLTPISDEFDYGAFVQSVHTLKGVDHVVDPHENADYGMMMAIWIDQAYCIDIFFGDNYV